MDFFEIVEVGDIVKTPLGNIGVVIDNDYPYTVLVNSKRKFYRKDQLEKIEYDEVEIER